MTRKHYVHELKTIIKPLHPGMTVLSREKQLLLKKKKKKIEVNFDNTHGLVCLFLLISDLFFHK